MVDSVRCQTYLHWELILVDDGSKDNSFNICSELSASDSRIRTIHKENGGVSSARNLGLEHAGGEYIVFLDSDDYVMPDLLNDYLRWAENCDLVISGFSVIWNSKHIKEGYPPSSLNGNEIYQTLFNPSFRDSILLFGAIWNKFYSTEIIQKFQLKFDENTTTAEDFLFNLQYLKYCNTVTTIDTPNYVYIENPNSITHGGEKKIFDLNKSNNMRLYVLHRISEVTDTIPDVENRIVVYKTFYSYFCDTIIRPTYLNKSCSHNRIGYLKRFTEATHAIPIRRTKMVKGIFNKTMQLFIPLPAPIADILLKALFGIRMLLTQ